MTDEEIEALAIRAAKGNNGGEWATHYTEGQKDYWRQFVRDLATEAFELGVKDGLNKAFDLSADTIRRVFNQKAD